LWLSALAREMVSSGCLRLLLPHPHAEPHHQHGEVQGGDALQDDLSLCHVVSFGCCSAQALRSCLFVASRHSTHASFVSSWRRNLS
jgi:hypothetical protein